jgi:hypothetical protein
MLTKTKVALATALVAFTSSVAFAQDFDPNLANRYAAYADPIGSHSVIQSTPVQLRTRDAALPTRSAPAQMRTRDVALPTGQTSAQSSWFEIERGDRASSPYAGGGGG